MNVNPEILPITYQFPFEVYYESYMAFNPNLSFKPKDFPQNYFKYSFMKGYRPTSGVLVLKYLTEQIKYRSITIVVFYFLKTKSFYDSGNNNRKSHSKEAEEKYVLGIVKNNKNITIIR